MTTPPKTFHMSPAEFRQHGRQVVDWIADYLESLEQRPVQSRVAPGEVRAQLPEHPPADGESFDAMLADVDRIIMPGITHWQHPSFFAYFNANSSGPSVLGELLSAGLGVQGMLWSTSPACTELEALVMDWLVEMLDLPRHFHSGGTGGGVIQDAASSATLCAILAGRERVTGFRSDRLGADGKLTVYASNQAHSSVEKAVRVAGLGSAHLRLLEVDEHFAVRPQALRAALRADRDCGHTPVCVVATIGTTSSTAIDPVRALGEICREEGIWLHVDAAHAGTAALCPEARWSHDGLELADSYAFNPHKWMFTNFDCDAFFVRDRQALVRTLTVLPEYLRNQASESGQVTDYRDWHIPLGRRFRALKLWFVIRHYGVEGLRHHVREHMRLARELAVQIDAHPDFELAAPVPFNLVCFRHLGGDTVNELLMQALNQQGALFLSHTRLNGRFTLRLNIGGTYTQERHVQQAWSLIRQVAATLD